MSTGVTDSGVGVRACSLGQRRFTTRRTWTCLLHYDGELPAPLVEGLWNDPDGVVRDGELLISNARIRTTVRVLFDGREYVLKRYHPRSWWHASKDALRRSRVRMCWDDTCRLVEAGVPTPPAVAYREDRFGPVRRRSFLLYEYVAGATLGQRLRDGPAAAAGVDDLARQFGELWQSLGRLRVSHCDMNLANFVVDPAGRLWIIDLDKMGHHRSDRSLHVARCENLARFVRDLRRVEENQAAIAGWIEALQRLPESHPDARDAKGR